LEPSLWWRLPQSYRPQVTSSYNEGKLERQPSPWACSGPGHLARRAVVCMYTWVCLFTGIFHHQEYMQLLYTMCYAFILQPASRAPVVFLPRFLLHTRARQVEHPLKWLKSCERAIDRSFMCEPPALKLCTPSHKIKYVWSE
jgi:hypothetical protein